MGKSVILLDEAPLSSVRQFTSSRMEIGFYPPLLVCKELFHFDRQSNFFWNRYESNRDAVDKAALRSWIKMCLLANDAVEITPDFIQF